MPSWNDPLVWAYGLFLWGLVIFGALNLYKYWRNKF